MATAVKKLATVTTEKIEKAPKAAKIKIAPKEGDVARLRIRVRAYEHKILDASVKQIMDTATM